MPVTEPKTFLALNIVDFQVNAHYTSKTIGGHGGESRDLRLKEYLIMNKQMTVIGLPEGKLLELNGDKWFLRGIESEQTLVFKNNEDVRQLNDGEVNL